MFNPGISNKPKYWKNSKTMTIIISIPTINKLTCQAFILNSKLSEFRSFYY